MSLPLKFISWNCRGRLLNPHKQKAIRSLISTNNMGFIGLIESKREVVDDFLVRKLWPNSDFGYSFVPSSGAFGGLILMWNYVLVKSANILQGSRWLSMDFIWFGKPIRHILVYASNSAADRILFWDTLKPLTAFTGLVILSGDFNEVIDISERTNYSGYNASMLALKDFINSSELMDIPLQGRAFTWYNSYSRSRIDRCFVSSNSATDWPFLSLTALPRGRSDHTPILFKSDNDYDWGPKPFRSINAWWDNADFEKFVSSSWNLLSSLGKNQNLVYKLKIFRQLIKEWNLNVFGNQSKHITELSNLINSLETAQDTRVLNNSELEQLVSWKNELWKAEQHMDSIWAQKSRINWYLKGDRNTKFYHSVASVHYRSNFISEIESDSTVYTTPTDIRLHIRNYFSNLFSSNNDLNFDLSNLHFKSVSSSYAAQLIKPFTELEIYNALSSCGMSKAPGPDEFNFFFYRKAWSYLKHDIMNMFSSFYNTSRLPKGLNSSFMVLIPKVTGSNNLKDYRPISLVNGIYKLLSKVLSCRLAPIFPSIISDNQNAFIKGQSILDCSLIANDLLHLANKRKDKLWIQNCLATGFTSVLVNGSPVSPFRLQRGVRQGDPISPFLFVIALESLNSILTKAMDIELIRGFSFDVNSAPISQLQIR
ncbi:uncharacterized protein LOC126681628 [Mercurialis annua]|uniref:uncharacterized protein LOC126681628 n=1 Tax=Mercurialis annua TaxID=3986 RepID=UPI00215E04B6|nr:uncharacterized protein LOC126681628 [Mercurialis annua]